MMEEHEFDLKRSHAERKLDDPVTRLELLRDAHLQARRLMVGTLTVGFGGQVAGSYLVQTVGAADYGATTAMSLWMLALAAFVYSAIAYGCARMIARAKGRGPGYVVALAVVSAVSTLVTPCFLGYAGCAVLHYVTEGEFRRAGVRIGLLGPHRAAIEARIDAMRAQGAVSPLPGAGPGERAGGG